jgi:[ribosomal protein S5]-alanine N-acetyltransferase
MKTNVVTIQAPAKKMQAQFLAYANQNQEFHAPWVSAPKNEAEFDGYFERYDGKEHASFWIMRGTDIAGVVNLNNIIRGKFQNAFLGYYGSKTCEGTGTMGSGMKLVLEHAYERLSIHRLECAIQPENEASLRFIRKMGFHFDGYAPHYLNINGKWRDHLKWSNYGTMGPEWIGFRPDPTRGL